MSGGDREFRPPGRLPLTPGPPEAAPSLPSREKGWAMLRQSHSVFIELDAGNYHANKHPLLPSLSSSDGLGTPGFSTRAPVSPPLLTSLLFFLKAHSLFFRSLAGQGI